MGASLANKEAAELVGDLGQTDNLALTPTELLQHIACHRSYVKGWDFVSNIITAKFEDCFCTKQAYGNVRVA